MTNTLFLSLKWPCACSVAPRSTLFHHTLFRQLPNFSHTSDRCTHDITMPWCVNFWMYVLTSVFALRLCTLSTDFTHECILYISPACRHVDPHYIWTSSLFNSSLCACICAYLCVCVCGEQLRYRACRGRELISAEDDCVIWTADQHWGSKWREAGELARPAAAC